MRVKRTFELASRFWKKLFPGSSKPRRASPTVEYSSGWNRLPLELVDEILQYLSYDLPALKACSLTCRNMLISARPLIGSWLYLSLARRQKSNHRSMKSLLQRSKRGSDSVERLADMDRRGLLPRTRHLVLNMHELSFVPQSLLPYIPYFTQINNLRTLVIDCLDVTASMPVFNDCLGMFTRSLRSLDIRHIWDSDRQLLWFISQFPLLEDLTIRSCYARYFFLGPSPPSIQTSPPFGGHLNLSLIIDSLSLCEALAQFPGGLNFTSIELKGCENPAAIIAACQLSLRSISYTWISTISRALDLNDALALEKFEFNTDCVSLANTPGWLYRTLWKINSRSFKEFTISVSNCPSLVDLHGAMSGDEWKTVDAYLFVCSKFQPSFKVVFRTGFEGKEAISVRELVGKRFPLVSRKGIMEIVQVRHLESWASRGRL